jgi:hypothetical protein
MEAVAYQTKMEAALLGARSPHELVVLYVNSG